jgi:hypothetical protein
MASKPTPKNLKPGSSAEDAAKVGGKGDFGVPESDVVGRTYTSRNTKASDPGAAQPHGGEDGNRTTGVGGTGSGVGASSGGDLDTDFVGIRNDPPPQGHPDLKARPERVKGTTHQLPDEQTLEGGADDASLAEGDSDAFSGEISSGEASGQDNRTSSD